MPRIRGEQNVEHIRAHHQPFRLKIYCTGKVEPSAQVSASTAPVDTPMPMNVPPRTPPPSPSLSPPRTISQGRSRLREQSTRCQADIRSRRQHAGHYLKEFWPTLPTDLHLRQEAWLCHLDRHRFLQGHWCCYHALHPGLRHGNRPRNFLLTLYRTGDHRPSGTEQVMDVLPSTSGATSARAPTANFPLATVTPRIPNVTGDLS
jgi:hypothetical protein